MLRSSILIVFSLTVMALAGCTEPQVVESDEWIDPSLNSFLDQE